jgi:hypothetical protein
MGSPLGERLVGVLGPQETLRETSRTSTGALVGVAPRGAVVAPLTGGSAARLQ